MHNNARLWRHFLMMVLLLTLLPSAQADEQAGADNDPHEELVRWYEAWLAEASAENPLLQQMIDAYQGVDRYEAEWRFRDPEGGGVVEAGPVIRTAFDRDGGKMRYRHMLPAIDGEVERSSVVALLLYDGQALHVAAPDVLGEGVHQSSPVEGVVAFEDFRQLYPVVLAPDLALLTGRTPAVTMLRTTPGKVQTLAADAQGRPGIRIEGEFGEAFVSWRLDPETHFVESFRLGLVDEPHAAVSLELSDLRVNEQLPADAFEPPSDE